MDVCSNHRLEKDAVFSLVERSHTAELFFTAVLCDLNETRTEIGLMNLVQSSGPPFRFPTITRGKLWRKRRQGLNKVKLGHPLHTHTHSHNHCQESLVYYRWSRHYPEINKSEGLKEKEKRGIGGGNNEGGK